MDFVSRRRAGRTLIENQAIIVFDEESSLATNVWTNTVAGTGTESYVIELPGEIDTTRFFVSWDFLATEDFSPRPVSYNIFVSNGDNPRLSQKCRYHFVPIAT